MLSHRIHLYFIFASKQTSFAFSLNLLSHKFPIFNSKISTEAHLILSFFLLKGPVGLIRLQLIQRTKCLTVLRTKSGFTREKRTQVPKKCRCLLLLNRRLIYVRELPENLTQKQLDELTQRNIVQVLKTILQARFNAGFRVYYLLFSSFLLFFRETFSVVAEILKRKTENKFVFSLFLKYLKSNNRNTYIFWK